MNRLEPFFVAYIAAWVACCILAAALVAGNRGRYVIARAAYWRFLAVPWKIATFAVAAIGITVIAPYTGDPTWDYFDAALMAALTFATAPWSVGTLYRALRGRTAAGEAFAAACAWLLSASWCYDAYLVLRDGAYPITWWSNLVASSILYACAGMLWNLEWRPGRGATFGFLEADWPSPDREARFGRLLWFALPFMALVTILIAQFLF